MVTSGGPGSEAAATALGMTADELRTERPVQLFVDDYKRRRQYHVVEKFIGAPQMTGRLAGFEVQPLTLPRTELLNVIEMMLRP